MQLREYIGNVTISSDICLGRFFYGIRSSIENSALRFYFVLQKVL